MQYICRCMCNMLGVRVPSLWTANTNNEIGWTGASPCHQWITRSNPLRIQKDANRFFNFFHPSLKLKWLKNRQKILIRVLFFFSGICMRELPILLVSNTTEDGMSSHFEMYTISILPYIVFWIHSEARKHIESKQLYRMTLTEHIKHAKRSLVHHTIPIHKIANYFSNIFLIRRTSDVKMLCRLVWSAESGGAIICHKSNTSHDFVFDSNLFCRHEDASVGISASNQRFWIHFSFEMDRMDASNAYFNLILRVVHSLYTYTRCTLCDCLCIKWSKYSIISARLFWAMKMRIQWCNR